jgi:glycerophosphoryl diester phosphodiesterase
VTRESLLALARSGVPAADLDLFWTNDGTVFVGHPLALQAHLGVRSVFDLSAESLEQHAPGIMRCDRMLQLADTGSLNITIALDLKRDGEADHRARLEALARQVRAHRLEQSVLLWVSSAAEAAELQEKCGPHFKRPMLRFVKPLRDRGMPTSDGVPVCSGQVSEGDFRDLLLIGPSVACATPALRDALLWEKNPLHEEDRHPVTRCDARCRRRAATSRWLTWAVDTEDEMAALLRLGVRFIISNRPLAQQAALAKMRAAQCGVYAAVRKVRARSPPPPPPPPPQPRAGAAATAHGWAKFGGGLALCIAVILRYFRGTR